MTTFAQGAIRDDLKRRLPRLRLARLRWFVCLAVVGGGLSDDRAQATIRTVAATGLAAPGGPANSTFGSTFTPRLNDVGQTVFFASIQGPNVTADNGVGVWSELGGPLNLAVLLGQQAAGVPQGGVFSGFSTGYQITGVGQLLFDAELKQGVAGVTENNDRGIWSIFGGTMSLVLREGSQAPGTPAGSVFATFTPVYTPLGITTVLANLAVGSGGVTGANSLGIWSNRTGTMSLVARAGTAAPGLPAGATFQDFSAPRVNNAGVIAFQSMLTPGAGGVTTANDNSIWSNRGGALSLLYRKGQSVAGVNPAARLLSFGSPLINNHGRIAFDARLEVGAGGVTAANDSGIWAEGSSGLRLVVREDQQAPGLSTGIRFREPSLMGFNDGGATVLTADVGGVVGMTTVPNRRSIWSEGFGSLEMVARTGDPAPGAPSGVNFGFLGNPLINRLGQVAFRSALQGDVTPLTDAGIWAQDRTGALQLIAMEGQSIEVAPGDSRVIGNLDLGDFNHRGEVSFHAQFIGGTSGVFVSALVALMPGDYNGSGSVGPEDYLLWKNTLGSTVDLLADGNGNGRIDTGDYTIWRNNLTGPFSPGDYSGNGTAGPEDYGMWRSAFGETVNLAADGNGNRHVDAADYTVWRDHLGPAESRALAIVSLVPEPTAAMLLLLGIMGLIGTRRR